MIYDILLAIYFLGTIAGLWFVFKKAGIAPWKAVVPLYNIVEWIRLCGKSWRWYIYMLIPGVNIFCFLLLVQETAKVFRRYGFWEQLLAVLLPCIYLLWLGLSPKTAYVDPREEKPAKVSEARDWTDAIVFAVIAAVLIRSFTFELYSIPSSSMEKSLLVGDRLLVSKMAYGPRVIMTPLSLPLMHNSIVGTNGAVDSYIEHPQLPYHRFAGLTKVKRFDAVVFNFPAGDTILSAYPTCLVTYEQAVRDLGREAVLSGNAVHPMFGPLGEVKTRPLDKRENYIKRCIGLPGEDLQIIDQVVYIDGKPIETPKDAQTTYGVHVDASAVAPNSMNRQLDKVGVSADDIANAGPYPHQNSPMLTYANLPLTQEMSSSLAASGLCLVQRDTMEATFTRDLFPNDGRRQQSVDNFGPVHIPAKGEVVELNDSTLPYYLRVITAYEGNTLEVRDGKYYINGRETTTYTVQQNYYWMMGDNRHNSQDSRFWGFVPEDHISGKARWVLWSWDKDHHKIRWNRMFKNACAK